MAEVYLTKEAYKDLEAKLAYLKSDGRVDVANKIAVARSFGDISENSEYDAAREEEALLEQEIIQIEENLRNAQIISKSSSDTSKIGVGATVQVYDMKFDENITFKIMGSIESDPMKGLISNESPTGKALIGKVVGDVVEASTPAGIQKYKVISFEY
jgi:transcription elongation factor GreA